MDSDVSCRNPPSYTRQQERPQKHPITDQQKSSTEILYYNQWLADVKQGQ